MAQIRPVTSEALEAQIRKQLPSQNGFTEDLQAQNVIVPVIDLTATTSGATTGQNLQTAISYGGITSFTCNNTTTTLMNSPGFWTLLLNVTHFNNSANIGQITLSITDGATPKVIFSSGPPATSGVNCPSAQNVELDIFLRAGDSVTVTSSIIAYATGCYRQIADVNGVLVNPSGFTPQ